MCEITVFQNFDSLGFVFEGNMEMKSKNTSSNGNENGGNF